MLRHAPIAGHGCHRPAPTSPRLPDGGTAPHVAHAATRPDAARRQAGFSLIEVAIVLLIVGLLLGGLVMPLGTQREVQRHRQSSALLDEVRDALGGWALANDALPCPATPASAGRAAPSGGGCVRQHGFVPAVTLGLAGAINEDGLLLDAWGSPLRYSVSASDSDGDGNWDFTAPGELRDVGMAALAPDLVVCTTAAGASATACASAATTVAAGAPAVLLSLGGDWAAFTSADQVANVGATVAGGPSGRSYRVAADRVFVSRARSDAVGGEYDDIVTWVSSPTLYGALVAAGRLP